VKRFPGPRTLTDLAAAAVDLEVALLADGVPKDTLYPIVHVPGDHEGAPTPDSGECPLGTPELTDVEDQSPRSRSAAPVARVGRCARASLSDRLAASAPATPKMDMNKTTARLPLARLAADESHVVAFKALAHLTRLQVFFFLVRAEREVPAGEIGEAVEVPGPTLSHHLDVLGRASSRAGGKRRQRAKASASLGQRRSRGRPVRRVVRVTVTPSGRERRGCSRAAGPGPSPPPLGPRRRARRRSRRGQGPGGAGEARWTG
jgi:hypothetical protein